MKDYQRAMLLLYPHLERYAENLRGYARAKALASSLGREDTEACVEKIIDCVHGQRCCLLLKALLEEVLGSLTAEERLFLDYKYFRRAGEDGQVALGYSRRTYFRRQLRLEEKLNADFLRRGMDERWFLRTFGKVPAVRLVFERVRAGKEAELYDRRARRGISFAAGARKGEACR